MEKKRFRALRISLRAYRYLFEEGFAAQVLATFERTCDLLTEDERVIGLVDRRTGCGPFHIVCEEGLPFAALQPGMVFRRLGDHLMVNLQDRVLVIDLSNVSLWNPEPKWHELVKGGSLPDNLAVLFAYLREHAPLESMASCGDEAGKASSLWKSTAATAADGVLKAFANCEGAVMQEHINRLCGLGPGLTPSGDDWLAGWLLGLRLRQTPTAEFERAAARVLAAAKTRTNRISGAFLRAAADGEVMETWLNLLEVLVDGRAEDVEEAARRVLQFGATSGADMLAGFLSVFSLTDQAA